MRLSKRLELVASFVREGSRIADVGTDHGYIPIALAERGIAVHGVAMDLREGPLSRAREHIARAGLSGVIETRLSDGLRELRPGEADTVIIAGMGGELVIHILEDGRQAWEFVEHFILSPQSELEKVRHYLEDSGFAVCREAMAEEDGKFYTVMEAVPAGCRRGQGETPASWYAYGRLLIEAGDPALIRFLRKEQARIRAILERLEAGGQRQAADGLYKELAVVNEALTQMGEPV